MLKPDHAMHGIVEHGVIERKRTLGMALGRPQDRLFRLASIAIKAEHLKNNKRTITEFSASRSSASNECPETSSHVNQERTNVTLWKELQKFERELSQERDMNAKLQGQLQLYESKKGNMEWKDETILEDDPTESVKRELEAFLGPRAERQSLHQLATAMRTSREGPDQADIQRWAGQLETFSKKIKASNQEVIREKQKNTQVRAVLEYENAQLRRDLEGEKSKSMQYLHTIATLEELLIPKDAANIPTPDTAVPSQFLIQNDHVAALTELLNRERSYSLRIRNELQELETKFEGMQTKSNEKYIEALDRLTAVETECIKLEESFILQRQQLNEYKFKIQEQESIKSPITQVSNGDLAELQRVLQTLHRQRENDQDQLSKIRSEHKQDTERLRKSFETERQKHRDTQKILTETNARDSKQRAALRKEIDAMIEERLKAENKYIAFYEELTAVRNKNRKLQHELHGITEAIESEIQDQNFTKTSRSLPATNDMATQLSKQVAVIQELKESKEKLNQKNHEETSKLREEIRTLRTQLSDEKNRVEAQGKAIKTLQATILDHTRALETVKRARDDLDRAAKLRAQELEKLAQKSREEVDDQRKRTSGDVEKLQTELKQERDHIKDLKRTISEREARIGELTVSLEQSKRQYDEAIIDQCEETRAVWRELHERDTLLRTLQRERDELEHVIEDQSAKLASQAENITTLENDLLEQKNLILNDQKSERNPHLDEIAKLREEIRTLRTQLSDEKNRVEAQGKAIKTLQASNCDHTRALETVKRDRDELDRIAKIRDTALSAERSRAQELEKLAQKSREEVDDQRKRTSGDVEKLQTELKQERDRVKELSQSLTDLVCNQCRSITSHTSVSPLYSRTSSSEQYTTENGSRCLIPLYQLSHTASGVPKVPNPVHSVVILDAWFSLPPVATDVSPNIQCTCGNSSVFVPCSTPVSELMGRFLRCARSAIDVFLRFHYAHEYPSPFVHNVRSSTGSEDLEVLISVLSQIITNLCASLYEERRCCARQERLLGEMEVAHNRDWTNQIRSAALGNHSNSGRDTEADNNNNSSSWDRDDPENVFALRNRNLQLELEVNFLQRRLAMHGETSLDDATTCTISAPTS